MNFFPKQLTPDRGYLYQPNFRTASSINNQRNTDEIFRWSRGLDRGSDNDIKVDSINNQRNRYGRNRWSIGLDRESDNEIKKLQKSELKQKYYKKNEVLKAQAKESPEPTSSPQVVLRDKTKKLQR